MSVSQQFKPVPENTQPVSDREAKYVYAFQDGLQPLMRHAKVTSDLTIVFVDFSPLVPAQRVIVEFVDDKGRLVHVEQARMDNPRSTARGIVKFVQEAVFQEK